MGWTETVTVLVDITSHIGQPSLAIPLRVGAKTIDLSESRKYQQSHHVMYRVEQKTGPAYLIANILKTA